MFLVDLVIGSALIGAIYGVFYVGFKAGGNYKTVREAFKAARDSVKG
jgi:hypothetical protein